jgi:hypothetical protein
MAVIWLLYSSHKRLLESRLDTLSEVVTKKQISWNVTPFITTFHNKKHITFQKPKLNLNLLKQ